MPNSTAKYESGKVERLKHLLLSLQEKGKAKFYEVFVDKLKVVEKTDDATEFDNYLDFLDDDTQEIKIVIYNTGNSPRNDQYTFELKTKEHKNTSKQDTELSGVELENRMGEKLQAERQKWNMELLQKENTELKNKIGDAEEYIEKLERAYEEEKQKKQKLGGIDVGDLASVALEGLIRRNTQMISKLPGGEALAGIIEQDNIEKSKTLSAPQEESTTSFKRKEENEISNPEDEERLQVLQMMQQTFKEQELRDVWNILKRLSENHSLIIPVLDLLNPSSKKTKDITTENNDDDEKV